MQRRKFASYLWMLILTLGLYLLICECIRIGWINTYLQSVINFACINVILATSLNVTVGCLGQITLGHAGFMSIGAYTAALLVKSGLLGGGLGAYLLSLLCGGILAWLVSFLIGIPALRLSGDYLAIITLGFGEIIRSIIEYFRFTGGAQGLSGIPTYQDFSTIFWLTVVSVVLMFSLMTSRHGRAILAIREDEIASQAAGLNTTWYKILAFSVSALFAGIAGGMYAQNLSIIQARQFDFNYSINILVMVVLGGMGSFTGATLAAVVLTFLPELLRGFAAWRMIVYALLLIIMMLFRPQGLLGRAEFPFDRILDKLHLLPRRPESTQKEV